MRIGVTLPTFSDQADGVLQAARTAETLGLHGVFVFDHLWPMRDPSRPAMALYPTMAAVLASTERIRVGSLVARLGLLPDEVVLSSIGSLAAMGGNRLIAAIGTGDGASADENDRLGIAYRSAAWRRQSVLDTAAELVGAGIECWVGAGASATNDLARGVGATLNFWGADLDVVRGEVARNTPVTWAGPLPSDGSVAARTLRGLADAGASWAVWGWPSSLDLVVEAAELADIGLEPTSG